MTKKTTKKETTQKGSDVTEFPTEFPTEKPRSVSKKNPIVVQWRSGGRSINHSKTDHLLEQIIKKIGLE